MKLCCWLILLLWSVHSSAQSHTSIWIEGESATNRVLQANSWYNSVNPSLLSGGQLVGHFGNVIGELSYDFQVDKPATYKLWIRANHVGAKIKYRINSEEIWRDLNVANASDSVNVAADGKHDLRFVAWIAGEDQTLAAGPNQLELQFLSDNHFHGAVDCICLTTDNEFRPYKLLKPGEPKPFWPAPDITEANFDHWMQFIEPAPREMSWRKIRWHYSLSAAAKEAKALNRPILLWAMNGHPCGET